MNEIIHKIKNGTSKNQLVCFPFLGGYANSYYELALELPRNIEVLSINPPGHGSCQKKPLHTLDEMIDLYYDKLKSHLKENCIFFGHSMGAIVAFFLVNKVMESEDYPVKPSGLIISASNSPDFFKHSRIASMSDNDLLEHMFAMGGIQEELRAEKTLLEYFTPIFRADFSALESIDTKKYISPIQIPSYQFFGSRDKIVNTESIRKWHSYFSQGLDEFIIDGGHMYVKQNAPEVAKIIEQIFTKLETEIPIAA